MRSSKQNFVDVRMILSSSLLFPRIEYQVDIETVQAFDNRTVKSCEKKYFFVPVAKTNFRSLLIWLLHKLIWNLNNFTMIKNAKHFDFVNFFYFNLTYLHMYCHNLIFLCRLITFWCWNCHMKWEWIWVLFRLSFDRPFS